MFDTITYIPTILAYTFISLLVVILCFIVIYVSHKVYLNIYDNLPVTSDEQKMPYKSKLPPALRICTWIGRSRLAELVLHPKMSPGIELLKYTESISSIPWNEDNDDDEEFFNHNYCGEYVT